MTERSDSSTIYCIYCLVIFSIGKSGLLLSCYHLITQQGPPSFLISSVYAFMVAMEVSNTDHVKRDHSVSLCFTQPHGAFYRMSSDWTYNITCRYVQVQNNALHFGGNTFCITFGSFSQHCLISSLYYTVLDILLWRKLHKGGFNNSWHQI